MRFISVALLRMTSLICCDNMIYSLTTCSLLLFDGSCLLPLINSKSSKGSMDRLPIDFFSYDTLFIS